MLVLNIKLFVRVPPRCVEGQGPRPILGEFVTLAKCVFYVAFDVAFLLASRIHAVVYIRWSNV